MMSAETARKQWAELADEYKPPVDEMAEMYFDLIERYERERRYWFAAISQLEELIEEIMEIESAGIEKGQ